jgi:DNA adenine methylase
MGKIAEKLNVPPSRIRTPLRYPGGKQRLAPFIKEVLKANGLVGGDYAEAYAGGAGIAIALLLGGSVGHIHLNDNNFGVYAFWKSVVEEGEKFCRRISSISLTVEEWRRQRDILWHTDQHCRFDVGFSLFYLNRCNRSGIPTGGIIGGMDQTGNFKMDARFPKNELIRRIEAVASRSREITVKNMDAEKFITGHLGTLPKKSLVYCDPPYFHKADRLYSNHYKAVDHARIAKIIQNKIKQPWIVSYDNVPEIQSNYAKRKSFVYELQYNAAEVRMGSEVFFFSDNLNLPKKSVLPYVNFGLESRMVDMAYATTENYF